MKKSFFLFLLLILLTLTKNTEVNADSIGVSPGRLVFDNINNFSNDFTIYNPNNDKFDFNVHSEPLSWLRFVPQSGSIEPNGKIKITAELIAPKTKLGTYNTFIYINSKKDNNNLTLIKTGAAIKAEIVIREQTKNLLMGFMIIITTIVLGVLFSKKINIIR